MVILGAIALIFILNVIEGLLLKVMWNWYVPLLGGPSISMPIAVGISCIVSMTTGSWKKGEGEDITEKILMNLLRSLIIFGISFVFYLFT